MNVYCIVFTDTAHNHRLITLHRPDLQDSVQAAGLKTGLMSDIMRDVISNIVYIPHRDT